MEKTKKLVSLLLISLLVISLTACSGKGKDEEAKDNNDNITVTEEKKLSNTDAESDISATLTVDKAEYAAGETINFTLVITNRREHWYTAKTTVTYTNSDGLVPANGEALPDAVLKLNSGEQTTLTGALVGDPSVFGSAKSDADGPVLPLDVTKDRASADIMFESIKTLAGRISSALSLKAVEVHAEEYETIKLRPYMKVNYAGTEVTVRAVIELHAYPEKVNIDKSQKNQPKSITVHDPSIFKDTDGKYYLVGTHITAGYSDDLRNWTSVDASFRSSFSKETIQKIREWNKDSGEWYGYLWAPDVVYNPVLKKYCYYLSANGDDWKSNIVMLTSDNILGPYEYAGSVVYGGFTEEDYTETDLVQVLGCDSLPDRYIKHGIANRKWGDKWPNCIDPCVFYDDNGQLWMSYGSWSGGIFLLELDEQTGLRDYSVSYPENIHSDPYFGQKIAGGAYVSGEGSFIQKFGDYYWLFMSYGNLESNGGYNVRVYRSETPNGTYVDALGNTAFYDSYVFNYNQSQGVRLFGGYKWRTFNQGQVAQGHNSAFIDDDGKCYIVYHSRTTDGSEGHSVKVHQLFLNEDGWMVAAPYITDGETVDASSVTVDKYAGEYEVILHKLEIDYKNRDVNIVQFIKLNTDGTVTGAYEGTWELVPGTEYINLSINGDTYKGVALTMNIENTTIATEVFTAIGENTQLCLWGSKMVESGN